MILRILRAIMRPEDTGEVLAALRAEAERVREWPGLVAAIHGLRADGERIRGLTLTAWTDYDTLLRVADGRADRDISAVSMTGLLSDVTADHYELIAPADGHVVTLESKAIGVIWGTVRANAEEIVHEMIRSIEPTVRDAGVERLYVGRRVPDAETEIVVVAPWRDRSSLHRFARERSFGAIDPAFTRLLEDFRFETYDTLGSDRLTIPSGPSVLVFDGDGRCVDATHGVERALGIPGELLLNRTLEDLAGDDAPRLDAALDGRSVPVTVSITPWPGRWLAVRVTGADATEPGLRAVSIERTTASDRRVPAGAAH